MRRMLGFAAAVREYGDKWRMGMSTDARWRRDQDLVIALRFSSVDEQVIQRDRITIGNQTLRLGMIRSEANEGMVLLLDQHEKKLKQSLNALPLFVKQLKVDKS